MRGRRRRTDPDGVTQVHDATAEAVLLHQLESEPNTVGKKRLPPPSTTGVT
jgi:hypothetical protein